VSLAACCGFDLCHKNILYLYLYLSCYRHKYILYLYLYWQLAACSGFDLCHKYIMYLYRLCEFATHANRT
jgi:hypothetical protein